VRFPKTTQQFDFYGVPCLNYGLELFLQKRLGKTIGWVGVIASRAERIFENINNGKTYSFKYD
jgi:hypothetical protein